VRCIKEDGSNYSVPVNQPVVQQPPPQPGQPPQFAPVDPAQQAEINGLIKVFDLAAGKYDVTCESGPSFTTRREEAAEQMMKFVQAFPAAAPIIGDMIAKNLDWPGADEMAKRLQAMLPPAAQGQNPQIMQMQQQMQQMGQQLQQTQQQLQEKQSELQIKQFEAETKRMQLMKDSQPTEGAPAPDHSYEAWALQYKEEQANIRKQMDIEAAERLELLKQQQPQVVGEELAEPEEEYDPETGELVEKPVKIDPIEQLAQMHGELMAHLAKPKTIVRDANGRAVGVQ
jgi:hypothetical protein